MVFKVTVTIEVITTASVLILANYLEILLEMLVA